MDRRTAAVSGRSDAATAEHGWTVGLDSKYYSGCSGFELDSLFLTTFSNLKLENPPNMQKYLPYTDPMCETKCSTKGSTKDVIIKPNRERGTNLNLNSPTVHTNTRGSLPPHARPRPPPSLTRSPTDISKWLAACGGAAFGTPLSCPPLTRSTAK